MSAFALRLALRELRGGLGGFRVFLVCLALGVAGIAAVGSVAEAIRSGLAAESREILGGDVAITYTYRFAEAGERRWMEDAAGGPGRVSETAELRSMIGPAGARRTLAQVKGVDASYPLYGTLRLSGGQSPAEAFARRDGRHGLVTEPVLAERLGLEPGDPVGLGGGAFTFRGTIVEEPDASLGGMALGPRVIASTDGLRGAGLLGPGTLFESVYRLKIPPDVSLASLKNAFQERFPEAGARWRDRRAASPGVERFVTRLGAFLTLVGLAALVVGGVGVGAAVRGYLARKTATIATLRSLGAPASTLFAAYLMQVGLIALLGIAVGLAIGGGAVVLIGPLIADTLPLPARFAVYPGPLAAAALYGALIALIFSLWPLSWLREVRPAQLFRGERAPEDGLPRPSALA
ncbi:MAG TPA: FtsX-like permease family protein, partial [Thermohalobaculum sp.]|nr:FtsX-like permease family protein [Thermohalobaculum sp.]